MLKKLIFGGLTLFVVACSTTKSAFTDADLKTAKAMYPNITVADLTNGKQLFETKCTRCHPLPDPNKKDRQWWNSVYANMVKKAKIEPADDQLIQQYVNSKLLVKNEVK